MIDALTQLTPDGMHAYLEQARYLSKMGRGAEPVLIFLQEWPQVARLVGESALPARELFNELRLIEAAAGLPHASNFDRPLPPFFVPVGTRDPLLDDSRRLEKALATLNVPCEARYYPGGIHAFHALVWDPAARRCWRDALAFLDRHVGVL